MVRVIGAMVAAHRAALADPAAEEPPLADALTLVNQIAPRGSEIVLASALDYAGSAFNERIEALASRTDVRILRIADAFETDPPEGRYRFATRSKPEGRQGRPIAIDGHDPVTRDLNIPVELWQQRERALGALE